MWSPFQEKLQPVEAEPIIGVTVGPEVHPAYPEGTYISLIKIPGLEMDTLVPHRGGFSFQVPVMEWKPCHCIVQLAYQWHNYEVSTSKLSVWQ